MPNRFHIMQHSYHIILCPYHWHYICFTISCLVYVKTLWHRFTLKSMTYPMTHAMPVSHSYHIISLWYNATLPVLNHTILCPFLAHHSHITPIFISRPLSYHFALKLRTSHPYHTHITPHHFDSTYHCMLSRHVLLVLPDVIWCNI